jgi:hypothetical protein
MKKVIIAASVLLFTTMVIVISSLFMADEAELHEGHIPDNIGPYLLTNEVEGEEAKQIMMQLHGEEVELSAAYVLEYQTRNGAYAIVWISESNEDGLTTKLYEDMIEFIDTNEMYSDHHEQVINNRTVQYGYGMERDNYYFANGNRFVWVATFDDKRDIFIKNAVKIF